MAFPGRRGRVGHLDLTQNIGQTLLLGHAPPRAHDHHRPCVIIARKADTKSDAGDIHLKTAAAACPSIEAIFPKTAVQTCVVHLIRHSLKYVPRREREQVVRDLKPIYNAVDADVAAQELKRFDEKWGQRFP